MANYIAKIGDFGLATKISLGRDDPEDLAKEGFHKENSPISSPPPNSLNASGTNSKEYPLHFSSVVTSSAPEDYNSQPHSDVKSQNREGFTPQVSPLPSHFGSESPPRPLPCAHHHHGHDGEEPRPCRRPGVRTCGIGTTLYAAPEQLYSHYYGPPVDIFSLGLILVEMYSTAESRKDRYRILKRARKGLLPQTLVETYPQEASLISQMLQLNASERPTTAEILRHPLLQFYVPSPRCSTPISLRRSNSVLAIPSPPSRSRSGRVSGPTVTPSEGVPVLSSSPPEGTTYRHLSQQHSFDGMVKSKRSTVQYRSYDQQPLSSPFHASNQQSSDLSQQSSQNKNQQQQHERSGKNQKDISPDTTQSKESDTSRPSVNK
jgi:hypothetical protein